MLRQGKVPEASVRTALADLRRYGNLGLHDLRLEQRNQAVLTALLDHASTTTSYYRPFQGKTIDQFPGIDKTAVTEKRAAFETTDPRFRKYRTVCTSGSTGAPFEVTQDLRKTNRVKAEVIYFFERLGYRLGELLVTLRPKSPSARPLSKLNAFQRNNRLVLMEKLDEDSNRRLLTESVQFTRSGGAVIGVPNMFESLMQTKNKPQVRRPIPVVASGETLLERTREQLAVYFMGAVARATRTEKWAS